MNKKRSKELTEMPINRVLKAFPDAEQVPDRAGTWLAANPLTGAELRVVQTKSGAVGFEADGTRLADVVLEEVCRAVGLKMDDLFPYATSLSPKGSIEIGDKPRKFADERFQPVIMCMADVISEPIKWLWPGYVALRKVCLVEGDPNQGKTWLCLAMAAAVSRGWPLPDSETGLCSKESKRQEPGTVFYLTAEDGLADTVKPRLENLGADCSRIHVIEGRIREDGQIEPVTLQDVPTLKLAMEQRRPSLLIVDPLQGFLGARVDMNRANQVRPVLADMMRLAEQFDCAVVIVRHLNKAQSGKPAYRGMGSIDFTAAARTILLVGKDPEESHKRIMVPVKCNIGVEGTPLTFTLTPDQGFRWEGRAEKTAEDILYPMLQTDEHSEKSILDEAQDFLQNILEYGPVPANEIFSKSGKAGISKASIRRAKESLKIQSFREPGKGREAPWMWRIRCSDALNERLEHLTQTPNNTSPEIDVQDAQIKIGEHLTNVRRFPPRKGNKR